MSNPLTIKRTAFTDFEGTDYGYRVYDNYDNKYDNNYDAPVTDDDLKLIQVVMDDHPDFFETMSEPFGERGVYVDAEYYTHDQIKHLLK